MPFVITSLGMNPSDDGHVVRVPIPALTEERRRRKLLNNGGKQEDAMIAVRNIRHEAMDAIDKAKKTKKSVRMTRSASVDRLKMLCKGSYRYRGCLQSEGK
ncbi:ribosome recycling factor [Candidatus Saccharibacteria bacterium]|nr:MAG: ribosome recycling factor [Candidatus Saccharibacteria bacterium]